VAITHFDVYEDVERQLDDVAARLDEWGDLAREESEEAFISSIQAVIAKHATPGLEPNYAQAAAPDQLYAGLTRYWRKRAEAVPPAAGPPVS
jgi:hypothetical protein